MKCPATRGAALPLALFVLAVLGVLAVSLLWTAHLESVSGRQSFWAIKARTASEFAWPTVLAGADSIGLFALAPGDSVSLGTWPVPGGSRVTVMAHRLGLRLWVFESRGLAGAPGSPDPAAHLTEVVAQLDSAPSATAGATLAVLVPLTAPFWSALPRAY